MAVLSCVAVPSQAAAPDLQCRYQDQGWVACRMSQPLPGEHWFLEMGQQRIEFRHDGSGRMRMRLKPDAPWLSVAPHWQRDQSLCWGEVCAKGSIPLD